MTWRLVKGESERNAKKERKRDPAAAARTAALNKTKAAVAERRRLDRLEREERQKRRVLFIAAPDATMTLDTLQRHLEPLLQHYPDGALLLLGLPGMPNTHWPRSANLTSASQGRAASQL